MRAFCLFTLFIALDRDCLIVSHVVKTTDLAIVYCLVQLLVPVWAPSPAHTTWLILHCIFVKSLSRK